MARYCASLTNPTASLYCDVTVTRTDESAIEEATRLGLDLLLVSLFILSEEGSIIWEGHELLEECNRRHAKNQDSNKR